MKKQFAKFRRCLTFMCAALSLVLVSCQKEKSQLPTQETANVSFPTTDRDKQTVKLTKEVGDILKVVYKNRRAVYEANSLIKTGFYNDERVLLKDLIFPETSPLYRTEKFATSKAEKGIFKKLFLDELFKGEYPNLKSLLKINSSNLRTASEGIDSTYEIWTNANGIAIYFPYSDNFPLVNPNDPNNNTPNGNLVTIVSADREADSGPGSEPYLCSFVPGQPLSDDNVTVCYNTVTVDDSYAELHPTHIVDIGVEPSRTLPANPPPAVNVVFIGDVKCMTQFDHLISFTGNGGGSELKFCRGSGYLTQDGNGQITNPQNVVSVYPTRSQIRNHKWLTINQIWDADWQAANLNQVFAIYEEDTQGSVSLSLSLKTTVKISNTVTGEGTVGFGWTFKTQDDIIRQLAWSRESFFQYNQGGLNNGCGTRNGFTEYDCTGPVRYTMPTQ